ncbi:hypothetical protein BDW71DRAFT_187936 [Aspergillus fruticulosus]
MLFTRRKLRWIVISHTVILLRTRPSGTPRRVDKNKPNQESCPTSLGCLRHFPSEIVPLCLWIQTERYSTAPITGSSAVVWFAAVSIRG